MPLIVVNQCHDVGVKRSFDPGGNLDRGRKTQAEVFVAPDMVHSGR